MGCSLVLSNPVSILGMGENNPWICICGKTNRGPACSNCGRTDESGLEDLIKGGQNASSSMRANSLGLVWATSNSSSALLKGCWIYFILIFGLPIICVIISYLLGQGR